MIFIAFLINQTIMLIMIAKHNRLSLTTSMRGPPGLLMDHISSASVAV